MPESVLFLYRKIFISSKDTPNGQSIALSCFLYGSGRQSPRSRQDGAALVVVMVLLVLMLGVILAFFSQSILQRQISKSSASQTAADLLAEGATNVIIGDLKQEIKDGSTASTVGSNTVYRPLSAKNAAPQLSNVVPSITAGDETDGLTNLLKVSGPVAFFPGGPIRGSNEPTVPSAGSEIRGTITPARWNKPLLMPATSGTDATPTVNSASLPKWVFVDRAGINGPNYKANMNWQPNTSDQNQSVVVGRYAYVVYNEGGLLDINVAGFPSSATNTQKIPFSFKSSLAFADLSTIPGLDTMVDSLIGWRNKATMDGTGSYPSYGVGQALTAVGPATANRNRYSDFVLGNTTGFLRTANTTVNGADKMFIGRQQLIDFLMQSGASTANMQNALQYLGTFSRDIDQPSFWPDPDRPKVVGVAGSVASNGTVSYTGGNNANGGDIKTGAQEAENINPPYQKLRISTGTSVTRLNGNLAQAGEPLLNRRFPLDRLAWITYKGPSASNTSDPTVMALIDTGITADFIGKGTADAIKNAFGLQWQGGRWVYNYHNDGDGTIRTLDRVRQENREPDFIELLKSAIMIGSKGKASAYKGNSGDVAPPYQHTRDTDLDQQIIQIAANVIDQFDADGYPTEIYLGPAPRVAAHGVENLPYIGWTLSHMVQVYKATSTTDRGVGVALLIPVIWNPHSKSSSLGSPYPSKLRLVAVTQTPAGVNYPSNLWPRIQATNSSGGGNSNFILAPFAMTENQTALEISPPSISDFSTLFREPTLLFEKNKPAGPWGNSKLDIATTNIIPTLKDQINPSLASRQVGGAAGFTDAVDGSTYMGIYMGQFPLTYNNGTGEIVATGGQNVNHTPPCLKMQYLSDSGAWITYDEKMFLEAFFLVNGFTPSAACNYRNLGHFAAIGFDPRTSRFGFGNRQGYDGTHLLEYDPTNRVISTLRPTEKDPGRPNYELFTNNANPLPAGGWTFDNGNMRHGLFTQNSQKATTNSGPAQYYKDADGVVRRAMGGFVPLTNGSAPTAVGLPMARISPTPVVPTATDASRPVILNRPFRSVAELGVVFSDTPWKNLDFSFPESGDSALLDVFCLTDDGRSDPMVAGKVDLNTRQWRVLKALLTGAYRDTFGNNTTWISNTDAEAIAKKIVDRTSSAASNKGSFSNIADFVGRFVTGYTNPLTGQAYDGFVSDIATGNLANNLIQRYVEGTVRAAVGGGSTRVWNLMIDVVAQSGRFPANSKDANSFIVEGEQRYWVHVAIDRVTGKIIDKQVELVKE